MALDIDDVQKLMAVFATKEDLRRVEDNMVTKDEFNQRFDQVMTGVDKVLKEVITTRQEMSSLTQRLDDTNEEVNAIKAIPVIAHELRAKK